MPRVLTGVLLSTALVAHAGAPSEAMASDPRRIPRSGVTVPAGATPWARAEGMTEYRLANGLRVVLAPDPGQATTTVNMTYLVGSRHESAGEAGMAHLLEHLLFKGTRSMPDGGLAREMASRGMEFNGTTSHDRTNYFTTFAASDDDLDWLLRMEAERMRDAVISRPALDSEMTVVRNELERGENTATGALLRQLAAAAYQWHPYGRPPIGLRSDIEHVDIGRLQDFYRRYYQPDNAVLAVTGQFDVDRTLATVVQAFGGMARPARRLPVPHTVEPPQQGPREIEVRRSGEVRAVALQYHIPAGSHPDATAMMLLTDILTDAPSGRLYRALVASGKAAAQSGFVRALRDPGSVVLIGQVGRAASAEPMREAMLQVVEGFASAPVTEAELERARQRARHAQTRLLDDPARYGVAMSEAIAKGDWRLMLIERDRIEQLTVADLQRVALRYLRPDNRTLGRLVPDETGPAVTIPATPDVAATVDGYRGQPAGAAPARLDADPIAIESRTTRTALSNGMQLALLPKASRSQRVHGRLVLRMGDAQTLRGLSAVGTLTAGMLMRGTVAQDRQQLADVLEALQATANVLGDAESVTVQFEAPRRHLAEVLNLVRDTVRHPAMSAGELPTLRTAAVAALQSQLRQPELLAPVALGRHGNPYPKGDPRYLPTPQEAIEALREVDIAAVRDFHARFYGADHAQLALVGDFDADAVRTQLETLFGDWRAPVPFERVERMFVPLPPVSLRIDTPGHANAVFVATLPIALTTDHPDYAALAVANRVFGGNTMGSRLAERLRQRDGISYGASTWLRIGSLDTAGRFGVQASFAPQNLPRLQAGVQQELRRLVREGIDARELAEARRGLLRQAAMGRAHDRALAGLLAQQLFVGRTMAFTALLEQRIASLTVEEVNAAVRRYLDPDALVEVYAGAWPEEWHAGAGQAESRPMAGRGTAPDPAPDFEAKQHVAPVVLPPAP